MNEIINEEFIAVEPCDNELRFQREVQCFAIVNRGIVWYKRLSEHQLQELEAWYKAWLDVTQTKQIPQMPVWLNADGGEGNGYEKQGESYGQVDRVDQCQEKQGAHTETKSWFD